MSNADVRLEALKGFQIFEGLSGTALDLIKTALERQIVAQGTQLIRQEQRDDDVFFVVDGRVRVEMAGVDGKTSEVLTTLTAGDTVGELALARVGRRTASAITQMESEIYTASASRLNQIFDQHPMIGLTIFRNLTRILASRLVDTNFMLRNTAAR
jgi:SulP family sulfate permease